MGFAQDTVVYRARRLGNLLWLLVFIPLTVVSAAVAYAGLIAGDKDVRGAWFLVPMAILFGLLSYAFIKTVIRPPRLEVSREGISWVHHFGTADASYSWREIDGPQLKKVGRSALFVCFVVKTTGREVDLALNDIGGATYNEIAAVISSAREGKIISPDEWRIKNPPHRLRSWLLNFGLPVTGAVVLFTLLKWFTHG